VHHRRVAKNQRHNVARHAARLKRVDDAYRANRSQRPTQRGHRYAAPVEAIQLTLASESDEWNEDADQKIRDPNTQQRPKGIAQFNLALVKSRAVQPPRQSSAYSENHPRHRFVCLLPGFSHSSPRPLCLCEPLRLCAKLRCEPLREESRKNAKVRKERKNTSALNAKTIQRASSSDVDSAVGDRRGCKAFIVELVH